MPHELSIAELENERVEFLPARTVLTTLALGLSPRGWDWAETTPADETNSASDRKSVV